jgi:hypothetical protein
MTSLRNNDSTVHEVSAFWDTTPSSPLKVDPRSGSDTFLRNVIWIYLLAALFMQISCLPYHSMLNVEVTCTSEKSVGFQQTNGLISQKVDLFIITDLRSSDSTNIVHIWLLNYLAALCQVLYCAAEDVKLGKKQCLHKAQWISYWERPLRRQRQTFFSSSRTDP